MNEPVVTAPASPEVLSPALFTRRNRRSQGFFRASASRFLAKKLNLLALGILGLVVLLSFIAPLISKGFLKVTPERTNILESFKAPGFTEGSSGGAIVHYLGTDEIGRDTLARLLHAGGGSLSVGFLVMAVVLLIGVPLGLIAGYWSWIASIFIRPRKEFPRGGG